VAAGQTSRDVAQIALDRLATGQAYVAGVVLNKFRPDPRTEDYYAPHEDYGGDQKITVEVGSVT